MLRHFARSSIQTINRKFSTTSKSLGGGANNILNTPRTSSKPAQTAAEFKQQQEAALAGNSEPQPEEISSNLKHSREILQHLSEKKAFTTQDVNQLETLLEKYVKQGTTKDSAVKGPLHFINAALIVCLIIVLVVRQRDSMYYEMVKELLLDSEDQLVKAKKEISELRKKLPEAVVNEISQKLESTVATSVGIDEPTIPVNVKKRNNMI